MTTFGPGRFIGVRPQFGPEWQACALYGSPKSDHGRGRATECMADALSILHTSAADGSGTLHNKSCTVG